MLSIALCDDEPVFASILEYNLKKEFQKHKTECTFKVFTDSVAFSAELERCQHYDVIFADIDMPKLNGIELGVRYRKALSKTILVYVSGREDLVFDAFEAQPFRFIRKKAFLEELPILIPKILVELQQRERRKISVQSGNTAVLLYPEEIVYVESFLKKQILHTTHGKVETQLGFRNLIEQLCPYGVVQIHKSYAVNCQYISAINRANLELDDHTVLPVGRAYLHNIQDKFSQYISNKL